MHPLLLLAVLSLYGYASMHWLPFLVALAGGFVLTYMLLESVFTRGAPPMSTRRKLMMASWATPSEAQVFGIITVNAEPLTAYLAKLAAEGTKISVTTAVLKTVALAMKEAPGLNCSAAFGHFIPRPSIDVSCLVALDDGSDLAIAKLTEVETKSLAKLADEIKGKAEKLRKHKDKDFEASKPLISMLPVWLLEIVVPSVGYLAGALGLNIPALGVRPFPFGGAMVTSVGMLGVEQAFVPFTPFARVPFLLAVGEVTKRPVVVEGDRVAVQRQLTLTGTLDHRYADGTDAARLSKRIKQMLENPELLEECSPYVPREKKKSK